jgi:hypothetical protein
LLVGAVFRLQHVTAYFPLTPEFGFGLLRLAFGLRALHRRGF